MREKLKSRQPDIYIDAGTGRFQVLDFLRVREILAAAVPAKEKLKAQLARVLGAETLPATPRLAGRSRRLRRDAKAKPRGGLLKRLPAGPKGAIERLSPQAELLRACRRRMP